MSLTDKHSSEKNNIVVFFSGSYIESNMANVVQTLQMANATASFEKVILDIGSKQPENIFSRARYVLGREILFSIRGSKSMFLKRLIKLIFLAIFDKDHDYIIIMRSPLAAIICAAFGQNTVLEMHSTVLSSKYLLAKIIAFILRQGISTKITKITISAALSNRLLRMYGFNSDLVLHDAWDSEFTQIAETRKLQGKQLVLYTGRISSDRGVKQILLLASKDRNTKFMIIGGSLKECKKLRLEASNMGLANLSIYPHQRRSRIIFLQKKADILLAFWSSRVRTIEYCSPLKLFEYMATGNKILIHNFPVFQEILPDSPLVQLCTPEDAFSEYDAYTKLKSKSIDQEDIDNMASHVNQYSYLNRSKLLLNQCNIR